MDGRLSWSVIALRKISKHRCQFCWTAEEAPPAPITELMSCGNLTATTLSPGARYPQILQSRCTSPRRRGRGGPRASNWMNTYEGANMFKSS